MLHVEPNEVVDQGEEDAQDEHPELALGDTLDVEHHVETQQADGQVEEVRAEEHHEEGQGCVQPEDPPGQLEPRDLVITSSCSNQGSVLINPLLNCMFLHLQSLQLLCQLWW